MPPRPPPRISLIRKILIAILMIVFWLVYYWYKGIEISRPSPPDSPRMEERRR